MISGLLATVSKARHSLCYPRVIGHQSTAVAIGAQILGRIETEAADISQRAGAFAFVTGPMRLAGVFDHKQLMAVRDVHNRLHIGRLSVQMHRNNRARGSSNRLLDE